LPSRGEEFKEFKEFKEFEEFRSSGVQESAWCVRLNFK